MFSFYLTCCDQSKLQLRMSFETGEESCHAFGDSKDAEQPNIDGHDFEDDGPDMSNYGMHFDSPTSSEKVYLL